MGADWKTFETAVRDRYCSGHSSFEYNKRKLASNTRVAMRSYGLIRQDDTVLTDTGNELYSLRNDGPALYERFAQHILRNLKEMEFINCILDMQVEGESIYLEKLRKWLDECGIHVP